jgi:hypothetical protein
MSDGQRLLRNILVMFLLALAWALAEGALLSGGLIPNG